MTSRLGYSYSVGENEWMVSSKSCTQINFGVNYIMILFFSNYGDKNHKDDHHVKTEASDYIT